MDTIQLSRIDDPTKWGPDDSWSLTVGEPFEEKHLVAIRDLMALKNRGDKALRELLRLYDWRMEIGGAITHGEAVIYGAEKKAAWIEARAYLESLK